MENRRGEEPSSWPPAAAIAGWKSPNLAQFEGVGIYYGATRVEAEFCRDDEVVVVGGGNSAGQAAIFLSGIARHVHLLVRGPCLAKTMSQYLIARIEASFADHAPDLDQDRGTGRRPATQANSLAKLKDRNAGNPGDPARVRHDRRRSEYRMAAGMP